MNETRKKSKLRGYAKLVGWIVLVQFVLINISAALHAHKLTHFYEDPELLAPRAGNSNVFQKTWKLFAGFRLPKSNVDQQPFFGFDTINLQTSNGINVDCWYSKVDSAKGTIILFHGLNSNKGQLSREAFDFRLLGYNVMLVDLRAHGNSGGCNTSVGVKESEEVKLAYNYCMKAGEKNIILYGISLGGVIIMKGVYDYGLRPSAMIIEMPFASFQDHVKARTRVLGFPEQPFGFLVTFWAGVERGFNGYRHNTTRYATSVHCPVLMQWARKDIYVQEPETHEVFEALSSNEKKLVGYENARHASLLQQDPDKWRIEVSSFLDSFALK